MLRYRYTCIVGTIYALLVYLLYSSFKSIKATRFFFADSIPGSIAQKIENAVVLNGWPNEKELVKFRARTWLKYRPQIIFTKVFAQDHFGFSPALIGHSPYTLIEDGEGFYTYYKNSSYFAHTFDAKGIRSGIKQDIKLGPVYGKFIGRNKYCINRLVTSPSDLQSDLLVGKQYELINLKMLWEASTPEKKQLIFDIFGLSKLELEKLSNYKIIVLTQPFVELNDITEEELMAIYKNAIKSYDERNVIIKPHPSEDVSRYKKYFPNAYLMPSHIPMQLAIFAGLKVEIAITIFSTAVSLLPNDTHIVWLGGQCHPKLERYGMNQCPYLSK